MINFRMRTPLVVFLLVSVTIAAAGALAAEGPPASPADIDGMLGELGKLNEERKEVLRDLETNLNERKGLEKEVEEVVQLRKQFEAARDSHNASCPDKQDWDKIGLGHCHTSRANGLASQERYRSRFNDVKPRWDKNKQAIETLRSRLQTVDGRIRAHQASVLRLKPFQEAGQRCVTLGSREAMHQCMQNIWDGARAHYEMDPMVVKPPFSAEPRQRTPEQAIEEYKKSGAPPGPKTLEIRPVPPPGG